eukprot:TRINITY_DN7178_c0_g1_i1.p1 TRINITY_DN7178_c0_g1~~TRINITY_DN7178_c0_g1_i1.p1  ORF type:complete len:163 (-),score=52.35 TRINITY_DN7178_c0_g1_i1:622-1110(-)
MAGAEEAGVPKMGAVVREGAQEDDAGFEVEHEVRHWMLQLSCREATRIREHGSQVIPLEVKNTSVVVTDEKKVLNRIEACTAFDFNTVKRIMVSEPVECPHKKGYAYVHVLCFTSKPIPLLLPYLFEMRPDNKLDEWLFINTRLEQSHHRIEALEPVAGSSS